MSFWSVNTLLMYYHQFLANGSHFAPKYIIITQLPPLHVNSSNPHSKLIYMEKIKKLKTTSAFNAWYKIQTAFGNIMLKNLTTTQTKTLLTKKCIEKY